MCVWEMGSGGGVREKWENSDLLIPLGHGGQIHLCHVIHEPQMKSIINFQATLLLL